LVLIATIGMAPAALATTTEQQAKTFVSIDELMVTEALTQLSLENDRLVDIVSNESQQLRVLALENEIVILDEANEIIAVIGDAVELQKVVPEAITIVDMQALEVEAIAVDDRELVILEVDNTMTVLSIAEIIAPEVTPRMVELTVDAEVPFWETTKVVIDLVDVVKTEQGVIALDQTAAQVHIFQSTQTLQYVQDAIISDLTEIVAVPAAITEVADHIVIADQIEKQLVLVPTTELLLNNLVESAIVIPITTEVVEIAAVADTRADTVKIVALDIDGQTAEKIVVELTHVDDAVRSIEQLTLMPTLATDVEVQITAIAIQEGNLLTIADNKLSTFETLELTFFDEPRNVVISKASIVRADTLTVAQTCSANVVDIQSYGILEPGKDAIATYQILTTGSPMVSIAASNWTAEGEVVIDASATSAALITDEVIFSETQLQTLTTDVPLTLGQVADGNSELKLQFSVPFDLTVEGEVQQQLALYAEC
jgi:hypothetical protein